MKLKSSQQRNTLLWPLAMVFFMGCSTEDVTRTNAPATQNPSGNLNGGSQVNADSATKETAAGTKDTQQVIPAPAAAPDTTPKVVRPESYYDNQEGSLAVPQNASGNPSGRFCLSSFPDDLCPTLISIYAWYNAKTKSHLYIPYGQSDCIVRSDEFLVCGHDILDPKEWKQIANNQAIFRAPSGKFAIQEGAGFHYLNIRRYTNPKTSQIVYSNQTDVSKVLLDAGYSDVWEEPYKLISLDPSHSGWESLNFVFWKVADNGDEWVSLTFKTPCPGGEGKDASVEECLKQSASPINGLVGFGFISFDNGISILTGDEGK